MMSKFVSDIISLTPSNKHLDTRATKFHSLLSFYGYKCVLISSFGRIQTSENISSSKLSRNASSKYLISFFWETTRIYWHKFKNSRNLLSKLISPIVFIVYIAGMIFINFYRIRLIRCKVLIVHESIYTFAALVSKYLFGTKIIVDVHDDYRSLGIPFHDHFFYKNFKEPFDEFLRRTLYKNAQVCFTVSNSLAMELSSRYGRNFEVFLNTNDFFSQNENLVRSKPKLSLNELNSEKCITGIFIGNYKESLNLSFLESDIWSKSNKKFKFVFYGKGYENTLSKFGQSDYVSFHKPIDFRTDVFDFNGFDFGFMPLNDKNKSVKFALPNGLFTLIDAQLPVLYPDLLEMKKLNSELNFGILSDFSDPLNIFWNISSLIELNYRAQFKNDLFYKKYTPKKDNDRFVSIIRSLLNH